MGSQLRFANSGKMTLDNSTLCNNSSPGDVAFVLINTAILIFIVPGFSFYYAGMTHPGSSVTMLILPLMSVPIVSLQWWLFGYSLAFSQTASPFIGDLANVLLQNVGNCPYPDSPWIPELVFSLYQCVTAMIPPAIFVGAVAERGRVLPVAAFIFLWTTFVYDVVCCWSLNPRGWAFQLGNLDYGGASPVHIPAGMTALAYSLCLRRPARDPRSHKPYAANHVVLGIILIWLSNYGNVSGAAMFVSSPAIGAVAAVTFSASSGAVTWSFLEYWTSGKLGVNAVCNGILCSLTAITPCAGFVSPSSSVIVGVVSATACALGLRAKNKFLLNDVLDVFVLHTVSGVVGSILTGIFTEQFYGAELLEGYSGGWLDGNWIQVPIQLLDVVASSLWSFVVSYLILWGFSKVACLQLTTNVQVELAGVDESQVQQMSFEQQMGNQFSTKGHG